MTTPSSPVDTSVDLARFYLVDATNLLAEKLRLASRASQLIPLKDSLPEPQETDEVMIHIDLPHWDQFLRALTSRDADLPTATVVISPLLHKAESPAEAAADSSSDQDASAEQAPLALQVSIDPTEGDWSDIELLQGKQTAYLFSERMMTRSYANWAFLAAEGDDLATFASCVREESKLYPRPMAQESLQNPPFRMSASHIDELFQRAQQEEGMEDICQCEASNGDVYYYSSEFLSPVRARSLAERRSVIIPNNP